MCEPPPDEPPLNCEPLLPDQPLRGELLECGDDGGVGVECDPPEPPLTCPPPDCAGPLEAGGGGGVEAGGEDVCVGVAAPDPWNDLPSSSVRMGIGVTGCTGWGL